MWTSRHPGQLRQTRTIIPRQRGQSNSNVNPALNQRPVWRPPDWWEPTPLQAAHRLIQLLAPTNYEPDPHRALFGLCSLVESEQCYFCWYVQAMSWQVMAIDISANYRNESGQVYPTTGKSLFDSKAFISIRPVSSIGSNFLLYWSLPLSTDIDECSVPGTCSHGCRNTFGSYACLCRQGYTLLRDGRSCEDWRCRPNCVNGGVCIKNRCLCPPGFSGIICQFSTYS